MLHAVISYLQDENLDHHTTGEGYFYAGMMCVSSLTSTLILHQYFFRVSARALASCVCAYASSMCCSRCSAWGNKFGLRSCLLCTARWACLPLATCRFGVAVTRPSLVYAPI